MKHIYLCIFLLTCICVNAQNSATISINKIRSTIYSDGNLFGSFTNPLTDEEAPVGSGKKINGNAQLWIGGVDDNGNLRVAAFDNYNPGPLDTITATADSMLNIPFDHVWRINKSMIQYFQQVYQTNPQLIPNDILTWPGNGTGGQAHKLAPFIDLNNNDLYEPLLGDYPQLTGDEMLYCIFNDNRDNTGCLFLGVEVHLTVYAYNCDNIDVNSSSEALNNSVFFKYEIYNRGTVNINNFYAGWWQDFDLGTYNDDFIGCDTARNIGFAYNGDNDDEGTSGYGLNPPMQSYLQLDGPLADANDNFDNNHDGVVDELDEKMLFTNFMHFRNDFSQQGNPESCLHIYNYLRSKWKDYEPLVNNGTFGFGSGPVTNYVYPTPPYSGPFNALDWNEQTAGNTPADRRILMSCGPTVFQPQSKLTYEYAIVYSHFSTAPNGANTSFALNNAYVDKVTDWYNAQSFPSCYDPTPVAEIPADNSKLIVYPNPATNVVNIKVAGQTGVLDFYMTDMAGKVVLRGKGNSINIDGLANGMYLLYVTGEKSTFYSKLIKQ